MAVYEIFFAAANSSANAPRPEPNTNPIRGRNFVLDKINFAARSARENSLPRPVLDRISPSSPTGKSP
jgi:hypothetical protein